MGTEVVTRVASAEPPVTYPLVLISPTVDDDARSAVVQGWRLLLDTFVEPPRVTAIVFTDYLRFGPRRFARTLSSMLADAPEDRMGRCTAPVLVIRGGRDPIVPHRWAAELAERAPLGRFVEIPGAGHVVQEVAAERVARLCLELAAAAGPPPA